MQKPLQSLLLPASADVRSSDDVIALEACVLHMTMNHNYTVSRIAGILTRMDRELTQQKVERDARYYVQALANSAHCVRRAYLKTEKLDGYQGKQAVIAKCEGMHEFAAQLYGEMLDSPMCDGNVNATLKRQLKSMITSMLYIAERLASASVAKQMWDDLEAFGITPTHNMYVKSAKQPQPTMTTTESRVPPPSSPPPPIARIAFVITLIIYVTFVLS